MKLNSILTVIKIIIGGFRMTGIQSIQELHHAFASLPATLPQLFVRT
jgi:hypothetical protein